MRALVREFMEKEVLPLEPALRKDGFVALLPRLREAREKARQTGLFAAHVPEAYGGAGLSLVEFAHMSEELGRSPIGHYVFNVQAPDIRNMEDSSCPTAPRSRSCGTWSRSCVARSGAASR